MSASLSPGEHGLSAQPVWPSLCPRTSGNSLPSQKTFAQAPLERPVAWSGSPQALPVMPLLPCRLVGASSGPWPHGSRVGPRRPCGEQALFLPSARQLPGLCLRAAWRHQAGLSLLLLQLSCGFGLSERLSFTVILPFFRPGVVPPADAGGQVQCPCVTASAALASSVGTGICEAGGLPSWSPVTGREPPRPA